ncbi:glycosyltransferase [Shimia sp. SDUM112013]|uniref:glycosyltransferase n=1 Tax=Shimia sp. SDUM112013 TaxID=3136160 RepID=UPI0032EDD722
MTRATILIPAHNEEAVIGRTLMHLSRGLPLNKFRLVVIANACTDSTVGRALSVLPDVEIIETDTPGKCHALNLGSQVATRGRPVICLDADLDVTAESLTALIAPLEEQTAQAACGQMDVRTTGASAMVRAYYTGWRNNPYFDSGKFGGLVALSAETADRLFPLPAITADDEFMRRSVAASDIAFVRDCRFTARAPSTLKSLIQVRRRSLRGARALSAMGLTSPEQGSVGTVLGRALCNPRRAPSILFYAAVNTWVRLQLLTEKPASDVRWERDVTTRVAG